MQMQMMVVEHGYFSADQVRGIKFRLKYIFTWPHSPLKAYESSFINNWLAESRGVDGKLRIFETVLNW